MCRLLDNVRCRPPWQYREPMRLALGQLSVRNSSVITEGTRSMAFNVLFLIQLCLFQLSITAARPGVVNFELEIKKEHTVRFSLGCPKHTP